MIFGTVVGAMADRMGENYTRNEWKRCESTLHFLSHSLISTVIWKDVWYISYYKKKDVKTTLETSVK
jgi:hypothetical protein